MISFYFCLDSLMEDRSEGGVQWIVCKPITLYLGTDRILPSASHSSLQRPRYFVWFVCRNIGLVWRHLKLSYSRRHDFLWSERDYTALRSREHLYILFHMFTHVKYSTLLNPKILHALISSERWLLILSYQLNSLCLRTMNSMALSSFWETRSYSEEQRMSAVLIYFAPEAWKHAWVTWLVEKFLHFTEP